MDTLSTMPPNLVKKNVSEFYCGFPEIQLKIFWPGYEVISFMERITIKGQSSGQIVLAITAAFQRFIQRALKLPAPPRGAAQYAITPNSLFAKKNHIWFRAIHHVGDDIFTLELECK
ncbi:uncharacterized protein TRAVEDRAFT_47014 [Trametes versicolor FP-101664 SS1]|uniref:uncharacterized protein n=1 Tax=Trametes versicolor (strain FP-101664) TaxID=717944 RepID=UPI00046233F7|nr:uncharacterized protein TRAVEDRAFT_47014 [Trametes versicolor FP-101664 SS1]EIW59714.1 hypothetical protein TRAVEDRAFT_47014 [Trametes versicolor FP-101664 SS1]